MVRARRVGNAVYLESHKNGQWGCGDIASWSEQTREQAAFVANQINKALSMCLNSQVPAQLRRDNVTSSI